jgi:hypothetical protein
MFRAARVTSDILSLVDDPSLANQTHWTLTRLCGWLREEKQTDLLEDKKVEVFFGDEAGFEGDPRPRAKWVKRGTRPTQGYFGGHVRQNVVGAVNPHNGQLVSLIVPHCDTEIFQALLDTMAAEVPRERGKRVMLVLDNAS